MEVNISRADLIFLLVCLALGFLAEVSFFHGRIGISYLVFLIGFYALVFWKFKFSFHHRRIGLLMMVCIWILGANYLFYDIAFFHGLNSLVIPALVFAHIVLITSPAEIKWGKPGFLLLLLYKLIEAYEFMFRFIFAIISKLFKKKEKQSHETLTKVLLGIVLALPVLLLVLALLMSADLMFENFVQNLPEFIFVIDFELLFRGFIILFSGFLFFSVFHILGKGESPLASVERRRISFNSISAITILILLNTVYFIFVLFQFKYFFRGSLPLGYTYAEYARKGFFELILVLLINWTILIGFLKTIQTEQGKLKLGFQVLASMLVSMSGIILISAFIRLTMYEGAYGFTLSRVLAHIFMIYLFLIFAYTFIRIWLEELPLLHFYVIVGIIFYAGIHGMNIEQFIINKNMDRYEETGKIDLHYLRDLTGAGTIALIDLYEKDPGLEDLEEIILNEKAYVKELGKTPWQSFNFVRDRLKKELLQFEVRGDKE